MRRLAIVLACGLFAIPPASAVDREFGDIVQSLSDEFRARPTRIPLFGLVNAFLFVARPAGTQHMDLAVFENLSLRGSSEHLQERIRSVVGSGWTPFVRVRSHRHGSEESVLVYMRAEGKDCRLLVTTIEPNEATVVQLKLNPEGVRRWMSEPQNTAFSMHRTGDE